MAFLTRVVRRLMRGPAWIALAIAAIGVRPAAAQTAARPFGWATAIADFNTDGKPDVAVADRLARTSGGYAYRIQLTLSGDLPRAIAFVSDQSALTIRAWDVDHDNDLDLVVSVPMSRETVGVWLNDGHGRFAKSEPRAFPARAFSACAVDDDDAAASAGPACLTSGRAAAGVFARTDAHLVPPRVACAGSPILPGQSRARLTLGSRAPPSSANSIPS